MKKIDLGQTIGILANVGVLAMLTPAIGLAQPEISEAGVSVIDSYLEKVVEQTYIPGLVAMVTDKDGTIYLGAFGDQDVAQGRSMTPDTIFRIASMTKPITSVAVMMLVEEGLIKLDDPISMHLPGLVSEDVFETVDLRAKSFTSRPANSDVTVRHLLTHTSGIGYSWANESLFRLFDGLSPPPSTIDYPLLHDPGTRWTYGPSTRVLGVLLEKISGQTLETFFRDRIFDPLEMSETSYSVSVEKRLRVATSHTKIEQRLVESPNPPGSIEGPVRGDGGLMSTAADYAKFIQMLLNEGRGPNGIRLLTEQTIDLMTRDHLDEIHVELQSSADSSRSRSFPLGAGRDGFGFGFQITGLHDNPKIRSPGSLSWAGLFNTQFWIDPERGIGAILLMQYLPFYDEAAIETLKGFEQRVYAHLE